MVLLQVYVASWHQTQVAVKVLQARSEGSGRAGLAALASFPLCLLSAVPALPASMLKRPLSLAACHTAGLLQIWGMPLPWTTSCWGG